MPPSGINKNPFRRPRLPFKSRKPRWRRAGTTIVTRSDLVLRADSLEMPDVELLATIKWVTLAASTQRVSRHTCQGQLFAMSERSKEKTYGDAEIEARLKKELPDWWLESGWIRRKYK